MKKYLSSLFVLFILLPFLGCDRITKNIPFINKNSSSPIQVDSTTNASNPPSTTAHPTAIQPAIGGIYSVYGVNPRGRGSYRGVVTITKQGDQYLFHWRVGSVYDGVGTLNQNTLTVEWGSAQAKLGVVTYNVQPDGTLQGTWFMNNDPGALGRETLTPQR